ncbi:AraC family transcriptional regulator [Cohnella caldifontis]|uniref:AraC family transcriptional regulator n=1 Tax=Cohnella caldifontis TaxID=3027471 RepID=UPI0023EDAF92|nr:AraC family transcriptional regulator [Cohnella sp. YIM B05605]
MEIVKSYRQSIPEVIFIGKKYGDADRVDGMFGYHWKQWMNNGWFQTIEDAAGGKESLQSLYEDGSSVLGFMRFKKGAPFEYWIGMFAPPNTQVPEGFDSLALGALNCGICWYLGTEDEIYGKEHLAMERIQEEGMELQPDEQGYIHFFERYSEDRFVDQDEKGSKILDIGFVVK